MILSRCSAKRVPKTKCTRIWNTQCLPCSNIVDIVAFLHRPRLYSHQCYGFKPADSNSYQPAISSEICFAGACRFVFDKALALQKAKAKVRRIHVRIANARRDYLHKTSSAISKSHAMVAVEDLQVKNMSRSASGIVQQPGRNVRAKAGLNRSMLDQAGAEFLRQLERPPLSAKE